LRASTSIGVDAAPAAGDVEEFEVADVFGEGRVDDYVLSGGFDAEQGAEEQ
jgi:hypothetical protein